MSDCLTESFSVSIFVSHTLPLSLCHSIILFYVFGSRSIAGTLTEPTVAILIDISAANLNYAVHIQHALRSLL